jgi:hypothetical protein
MGDTPKQIGWHVATWRADHQADTTRGARISRHEGRRQQTRELPRTSCHQRHARRHRRREHRASGTRVDGRRQTPSALRVDVAPKQVGRHLATRRAGHRADATRAAGVPELDGREQRTGGKRRSRHRQGASRPRSESAHPKGAYEESVAARPPDLPRSAPTTESRVHRHLRQRCAFHGSSDHRQETPTRPRQRGPRD